MEKILVGLYGPIASGKTTIARHLEEKLNFNGFAVKRMPFAWPLKEIAEHILPIRIEDHPLERWDHYKRLDNLFPIEILLPDVFYRINLFLEENYLPPLSPEDEQVLYSSIEDLRSDGYISIGEYWRLLLQWIGTDVVRKRDRKFWIRRFINSIRKTEEEIIIIEDGRFENELLTIRENKGITIGLPCSAQALMPHQSEWEAYETARKADFIFYIFDPRLLIPTAEYIYSIILLYNDNLKREKKEDVYGP